MMQTGWPRPLWSGGRSGSSCQDLLFIRKTGEETRKEESRGDGGEKEGTLIFADM